jgi:hypothetical protein
MFENAPGTMFKSSNPLDGLHFFAFFSFAFTVQLRGAPYTGPHPRLWLFTAVADLSLIALHFLATSPTFTYAVAQQGVEAIPLTCEKCVPVLLLHMAGRFHIPDLVSYYKQTLQQFLSSQIGSQASPKLSLLLRCFFLLPNGTESLTCTLRLEAVVDPGGHP